MTVLGYARVSTGRQVSEGESLQVQQRMIEGYATMHSLHPVKFHIEEGVSGSVPFEARPQGHLLFTALQPGDTIIAAKLDRMFRSAKDALDTAELLRRRKVNLHLIDLGGDIVKSAVSKLFFTIVAAFAEAERDRNRERIVQVKQDQRARKRMLGGFAPFGFFVTPAGFLRERADRAAHIDTMRGLRRKNVSYRDISDYLRQHHGFRISHQTVKNLLDETRTN